MAAAQGKPGAPAGPSERDRKAAGRGGEVLGDFLNSSSGRQLEREVVRGLFGMLEKAL